MDFSPPSRFPLLRGDDPGAGLLTRRAEHGVQSFGSPKKPSKRWQAYFSHGTNNLDATDTWSQSYEMDEKLEFGPPEEEGTWVLVHDDYWDRRDRLRRNVNPSEEIFSSTDARRHDRSANPESWTVWHGGPKQDGSGKFVSAHLGWDATQFPGPDLGDWRANQANWEGADLSEKGPTVQRKPEAPRAIRNLKEQKKPRGKPRKPRGKPRKARRPPKQDLFSFVKSLNPLLAPKAQEKQHNAFQAQAQGAIRNTMDTMMGMIRSGDERHALFRQMMTPRR